MTYAPGSASRMPVRRPTARRSPAGDDRLLGCVLLHAGHDMFSRRARRRCRPGRAAWALASAPASRCSARFPAWCPVVTGAARPTRASVRCGASRASRRRGCVLRGPQRLRHYRSARVLRPVTTCSLRVGQGDVIVTPLQIARLYAAIANCGNIVQPHLTKSILNRSGREADAPRARSHPRGSQGHRRLRGRVAGALPGRQQRRRHLKGVFNNWPMNVYPSSGRPDGADRQESGAQRAGYLLVRGVRARFRSARSCGCGRRREGRLGAQTAAPIVGEILKSWYDVKDAYIRAGTSKTK